jgi:two-component system OmpR family response regulator
VTTARVLLAEDDLRIASLIERALTAAGYDIESVHDGQAALERACSGRYALVILDRRLPKLEGLEVSRQMRLRRCRCRVLMLTALDTLQDKVDGLRGGADDYLTKPFAFDELLARVAALLRRDEAEAAARELVVGGLTIDRDRKEVWRDGRRLALTATEYALLVVLAQQPGTVFTRAELRAQVWDRHFDTGTKIVDVYIRYLRQKVDRDSDNPLIHTVRGFGYTLSERSP